MKIPHLFHTEKRNFRFMRVRRAISSEGYDWRKKGDLRTTDERAFGHSEACTKCQALSAVALEVRSCFWQAGNFRVMLIGQDPTTTKDPERVEKVLVDQENS